ncbi:MAG: heavy-metal-associated domain-containing protein [Myxococcota bacterium]
MRVRLALPVLTLALLLAAPLGAEEPAPRVHEFQVTGMTCGLCAKAVEKGLRGVEGVRDVTIDRQAERVRVIASPGLGDDILEAAIEGAGSYQAEPIPSTSRDEAR